MGLKRWLSLAIPRVPYTWRMGKSRYEHTACREPWLHEWGLPDYSFEIESDAIFIDRECKHCGVTYQETIRGQYSHSGLLQLTFAEAKKLSAQLAKHDSYEFNYEIRWKSMPGYRFYEVNGVVIGTNTYVLESPPDGPEREQLMSDLAAREYRPCQAELNRPHWYVKRVSILF